MGTLTLPLALENIRDIFAICPCTMLVALQLPQLLSIYQQGNKNIIIRMRVCCKTPEVLTNIFDKTGTLTTGHSLVTAAVGLNNEPMDDNILRKVVPFRRGVRC